MIRWLYMCSDLGIPLDGTKGAAEHVRAITRALCSAGDEVYVLAARGRLPMEHPAAQLDSPPGRDALALSDELRPWLSRADASAGLAGEFGQMMYDVRLDQRLRQDDAWPAVDVVLERLSLFCTAGREFARRRGVPYLLEMNAPLAAEAHRYRDAGLQQLAQQVERRALCETDLVLTVSESLRRYVIDDVGVQPDRVVTVPNGVELDLFSRPLDRAAARDRLGIPRDAVVFGFVGSLRPWHGLDTLLAALARVQRELPQAHLLVVGEGRLESQYRAQARALGVLPQVTFFGGAPHEQIPELLAAMDVGVAPYLPQENFYFSPLKLVEYMAAGLCVIASRAGQIAEMIEHGRSGLLFEAGSDAELAECLLRAGRDARLRRETGASARQTVARRGWNHVAAAVRDLALGLISRNEGRNRPEPTGVVEEESHACA